MHSALAMSLNASSVMHIDLMFYSTWSDERINLITAAGEREDDVERQICDRKEEFNAQLRPASIRLACLAMMLCGIKHFFVVFE